MQNGKPNESRDKPDSTDIIEKCIGTIGKYQIWVCFLIYLTKFGVAWHQLNIVFLAPPVEFKCKDADIDKCSSSCTGYVYDNSTFPQTITTQWNLVCNKQYLESVAQVLAVLGILAGSMIFGYLSDRYGRKNPLVLAIILQAISGIVEALSPWFYLFLLMRFLASLATGGTMVVGFVLVMELVGIKWRTPAGVLYQIPFSLGHMVMAIISYYLPDWRHFILATSAPSLLLMSYYWIVPESPRWQLAVGRKTEAIETLRKAARTNKLPTDNIEQDVTIYLEQAKTKVSEQSKGNVMDLLRTPIMRLYTIILWLNWVFCSFAFYGASQMMGQLGGNIFINVGLSGAIEIPGILFCTWAVDHWGRRRTLILGNCFAGIALVITGMVPDDPVWIKPMLGSFGICSLMLSFCTVYIYAGEVFPTVVRNIGLGTSSTWARVGSMIAPFIATLKAASWVTPVIFGVVMLISAVLCLKLPETMKCKLPETIEEVEQFDRKKSTESTVDKPV